jgi:hypothetical protein
LYPAGGFRRRKAPTVVITAKVIPKTTKVVRNPYSGSSHSLASGPKIADPPP